MRDHRRERHRDGSADHHDDDNTTTTVAPTTTTTVFNGLAQTGSSSSVPLSVLGVVMSAVGGLAVMLFRARRDYRLPQ